MPRFFFMGTTDAMKKIAAFYRKSLDIKVVGITGSVGTMQELADRVGIELPKQEMTSAQRREADRRTQLLEIIKRLAKYFYMLLRGPRGQRAHEYFKKRELSDETMQKVRAWLLGPVQ